MYVWYICIEFMCVWFVYSGIKIQNRIVLNVHNLHKETKIRQVKCKIWLSTYIKMLILHSHLHPNQSLSDLSMLGKVIWFSKFWVISFRWKDVILLRFDLQMLTL